MQQANHQGTKAIVLPNSVIALYFLLTIAFLGGARLLARSVHDRPIRGFRAAKDARDVLIVGAGDGGRLVLREILRNRELGLRPVGFVDDDPLKRGFASTASASVAAPRTCRGSSTTPSRPR